MKPALIAAAIVLTAAAPAAAAPARPAYDRELDADALALVNTATKRVIREDPTCRPASRARRQAPILTDADPSAGLLGALGVMRRAPTAEERSIGRDTRDLFSPFEGEDGTQRVYTRYARIVRMGGFEVTLRVVNFTPPAGYDPAALARCEQQVRVTITSIGRDEKPEVRRRALVLHREFRRDETRKSRFPSFRSGDSLITNVRRRGDDGSSGSGGGRFDARRFNRSGDVSTSGSGDSTDVVMLVPDGVASVEARYGRVSPNSFAPSSRVETERIIKTVDVVDNVVAYRIARGFESGRPLSITWRDADGKVLRTKRGSF